MFDLRRNKTILKITLIWIFCAVAALYIRLYPLWGHIWSPSNEQATMAVVIKIKQSFLDQLHSQFPRMPIEEADRLATNRLNETLHKDGAKFQRAVEQVNQAMFRQSGSEAKIYLLEADPFYYYNLTANINATGRIAATIKGNKYFNPLMGAPFGYWQPLTIHPYVGYLIFKFAQIFNSHVPLMSAVAFTPLLITALGLIAFIWCSRILGLSPSAILLGCFYLSMAPIFLKRSALGWYDTDPYNILFPFLFLGLIFKGLSKKPVLYGVILVIALTFYSLLWQGWVFLFVMTFICTFAAVFTKSKGNALKLAGTYLGLTICAGLLIYGLDFFSFFSEGAGELAKFTVKGLNLWPNLFIEVGELKKSTWGELFSETGGPLFTLGALIGLWSVIKNFTIPRLIITIFLLVTMVMTFKASRFAIFTLIPLSLLFAFGIDWTLAKVKEYGAIFPFILVIALLIFAWNQANTSIRTVLTPIYNNAWEEALTAIKIQTPEDSIINTWWPPGHFIKGIAQRKVLFDGASLSEGATGYWMANVLLSTNEDKARGLLRMMNLSGNRAAEFLAAYGLSTSQSVAILHRIAPLTTAQAREALKPFIPKNDDLEHLLLLTHGGMPHSYVLVYNELADENIGLSFVGKRDFQKIEQINANPNLLASIPAPDSPGFIDFLWSLAGGPSKYSEAMQLQGRQDDKLIFDQGVAINADMGMARISSPQYGQGIPLSLVYEKDGHIIERELPGANLNYSVMLYAKEGQPTCRLMDRDLANSLIMKMFYFDGVGLKDFKMIKSTSDLTGRTQIKVFEVLWN